MSTKPDVGYLEMGPELQALVEELSGPLRPPASFVGWEPGPDEAQCSKMILTSDSLSQIAQIRRTLVNNYKSAILTEAGKLKPGISAISLDAFILRFPGDRWYMMDEYARVESDCLLLIPLSIPDDAEAAVLGQKIDLQKGKSILTRASSKIWVGGPGGTLLTNPLVCLVFCLSGTY
ncbi:hypothetical protein NKR23_g12102 [Pleurostoma richardsiae]|uniref:Uncharacterized protein n=1 Tax=Pleurostoma richardsiae TaxID=41990 RepID=A0AA38R8W1_9PEZI|nr:hypothetical protein NKR23_g12102 [Pleurostoma richardsiae]